MAALFAAPPDDKNPFCEGSLIASKWVLTDAKCPKKKTIDTVVLGEYLLYEKMDMFDNHRLVII